MSTNLLTVGFNHPFGLFVVLVAPLLTAWALRYFNRKQKGIAAPLKILFVSLVYATAMFLSLAVSGLQLKVNSLEDDFTRYHISVVLDDSGTMSNCLEDRKPLQDYPCTSGHSAFEIIQKEFGNFIDQRASDRFAITLMGKPSEVLATFKHSRSVVADRLSNFNPRLGDDDIVSGIRQAIAETRQVYEFDRVILIMSDGLGRLSPVDRNDLVKELKDSKAKIYWLLAPAIPSKQANRVDLQDVMEQVGATVLHIYSEYHMSEAFAKINRQLKQYEVVRPTQKSVSASGVAFFLALIFAIFLSLTAAAIIRD